MSEAPARRSAEELAALMASSADSPGQQLRQT
ncbi:MAG: hypothetical protein QOE10_1443, partial [Gaiellales bacterium]|nr:hypothetical protein [Gaiellales bacterium]